MSREHLVLPVRYGKGDSRNVERAVAVSDAIHAQYRREWRAYVELHSGELPAKGPRGSMRNRKRAGKLSSLWHQFMRERRETVGLFG